jgi:hypothetical protein
MKRLRESYRNDEKLDCDHKWRKVTADDTDDLTLIAICYVCKRCDYLVSSPGFPRKWDGMPIRIPPNGI